MARGERRCTAWRIKDALQCDFGTDGKLRDLLLRRSKIRRRRRSRRRT